jgi:hypothetical protein
VAALLVVLLARDLDLQPERALAAILPLPPNAAPSGGGSWLRVAAAGFAAVLALVPFEKAGGDANEAPFLDRYTAWPRALARVWRGNLATGLTAVQATLVSFALALAVRPASAAALGEPVRLAARHGWWVFPLAVAGAAWVPMAARDAVHAIRRSARLPRGAAVVVMGAVSGAMLAWGYFPSLLGHLSPRAALARYRDLHAAGEPIGALGVSARAAALEVGAAVRPIPDATAAAAFLASHRDRPAGAARSWLVVRAEDLPPLNALVRAREGRNAVVVVGGAGDALLVASDRAPGDPVAGDSVAEGSLDDLVRSSMPPSAFVVEAGIGDALTALGWDLRDAAGAPAGDAIAPLATHRLRLYYRVEGSVDEGLCSFVHVDGQGRRFNVEHREFRRYPLRYWQRGDVIVDEFEVTLGANFTPGPYALRYGFDRLPCDGHARLVVKSGPHDADNRVLGGTIHVR